MKNRLLIFVLLLITKICFGQDCNCDLPPFNNDCYNVCKVKILQSGSKSQLINTFHINSKTAEKIEKIPNRKKLNSITNLKQYLSRNSYNTFITNVTKYYIIDSQTQSGPIQTQKQDPPKPQISKDFSDFVALMPRTLHCKIDYSSNAPFVNDGIINLDYKNGELIVKGNLDYETTDKFNFKTSIRGTFEGNYFFKSDEMLFEFSGPGEPLPDRLKCKIIIHGTFNFVENSSEPKQFAFNYLYLYITDLNRIRCEFDDRTYYDDRMTSYLQRINYQ
ncbi:hypothetical protein HDF19_13330 [Mucilaginibacter sp. E4BP6]|uniref:hypothetical protein n=1 Tax=Mucilaginibacter sp. E4BP6 TaxID=2723089 RepID=UPI0015C7F0B1|nr:hypothetical protein [Mucilaginibacter sp. E4BP6]NYE66038.1 hypothetical protein [Mucilaginibacter sp. E4BP6]